MEQTDAQLIGALNKGDKQAFNALVQRHLKSVYAFNYRLTGHKADAEDATQDVFIKLWRNSSQYKPNKNFKAWLFRITHNTAVDLLRKKKSLMFSDFQDAACDKILEDTLADPAPLPEELIAKTEDKKLLDSLLSQLPTIYREVLLLHYTNHLTFEEIGHIMGKPMHTVKSWHRRSLLALRKILENSEI